MNRRRTRHETRHGTQDTGHRTRVTEHRTQDTGHRTRVTDHRTRVTGQSLQQKKAGIKLRGDQIQSDYFNSRAKALKNNEYLIQKKIQFLANII